MIKLKKSSLGCGTNTKNKAKRIFIIADFKDESSKSVHTQPAMWVKGLLRLGQDVQRFSYRNMMMQCAPFPTKRIARRFSKRKTDRLLFTQIKQYHPDIIIIHCMKYLDAETVMAIRELSPKAVIVGRDEDPFPDKNPLRMEIAKQTDIMITTSAGRFLKVYKDAGISCCAFIPNMCDPDIQYNYNVEEKWKTDIIFTGKPEHKKLARNNERYDLVKRLSQKSNAKIYGAFGIPGVEGIDYFYAISGAKIGLSTNIENNVRLYHSDRFINYISCGTFTLAKKVPDTDLLFENNTHVKYFDTAEEFFELADYYLNHEQEREKIAQAGMQRAHTEFNTEKITKQLMDLIETGTYDAPWSEIL